MNDAAALVHHLLAAWRAIDSLGLAIALVLLCAILAAAGGLVAWRYRVYGALMGGMIANAFAKANGANYEAAFVATLGVGALGLALGGAGLLGRLIRIVRR